MAPASTALPGREGPEEGAQRRFEQLFRFNPLPMALSTLPDGVFTEVNDAWLACLGFERAEVIGQTAKGLGLFPDAQRQAETSAELGRLGAVKDVELRVRAKDGRLIDGLFSGETIEIQGARYALTVMVDVTERKRAAQALAEREELLANVVGQALEGISVVDLRDGRFVEFNRAAHEGLGYTRDEFSRLRVSDIQAEHSPAEIQSNFEQLRLGETLVFETKHRHRDGSLRQKHVSVKPLVLPGRDCAAVVWMDITERMQTLAQLRASEEQLRQAQKLESIGQLAGGVAHDFNNIIASFMMHLGLLEMNSELSDETRQALAELERESIRAAALTRQLLMFSRRSVLSLKPLDVTDVVTNLLKMLSRLIGEHVVLRFNRTSAAPVVLADAGLLDQVVMNLVVNARDAMPRGGAITLTTSSATFTAPAPDNLTDGQQRPGHYACLEVTDNGCGMDADTVPRIFEPFFTTKEPGKGTGLGLATVHGIVAQHHGWIEVASTVGTGSTFRVFLPAIDGDAPQAGADVSTDIARGSGETVLLVEDEASLRRLLSETLNRLSYRVLEAANGQEAIRLWQTTGSRVDLLLTDMIMPEGMTGLELAERLRETKPDLRVIIASGYNAEVVRTGVPDKKGYLYLPKPFSPASLGEAVRKVLDQTR